MNETVYEPYRHKHIKPSGNSYDYPINTVIKSPCGHYFVVRMEYPWPFGVWDNWKSYKRLRPWHISALFIMLFVSGRRK